MDDAWMPPADVRQARLTFVGLALMAVISAALLTWAVGTA